MGYKLSIKNLEKSTGRAPCIQNKRRECIFRWNKIFPILWSRHEWHFLLPNAQKQFFSAVTESGRLKIYWSLYLKDALLKILCLNFYGDAEDQNIPLFQCFLTMATLRNVDLSSQNFPARIKLVGEFWELRFPCLKIAKLGNTEVEENLSCGLNLEILFSV